MMQQTYAGYPMGIHGLGGIGQIAAPFFYVPDLAPVGSGKAYFPRDVEQDAKALNFLGFMSDEDFSDGVASTLSQSGDIATESGAWDPLFRAAVSRYQAARGLIVDSWVGPQTRTSLAKDVTLANAKGVVPGPVPKLPPQVLPVNPGGVPAKPGALPGVTPASTGGDSDETLMYVGIGVGVVALLGVGWWAFA